MALNVETTSLVLDVYDHDHKQQTTIKAIALDSKTRYVTATITKEGAYYSIDPTAEVTLTVIRTDNTGVQITGTPYEHRVNTDGAEVTLYGVRAELSQAALAKSGTLRAQFKMTLGEQILRTEVFKINNGIALDTETSDWAGEYQGYDLEEIATSLSAMTTATAADVGKYLRAVSVEDGKVVDWQFSTPSGGGGGGGDGQDGFSPIISVANITGGHRVSITDVNGTKTFDVMDGTKGSNGFSPTVTVTNITGGHRVSITDATGTKTFDVMDGSGSGGGTSVTIDKTLTVEDAAADAKAVGDRFNAIFTEMPTDNLFNKDAAAIGSYVNPYTGEIVNYDGVFHAFIELKAGTYTFLAQPGVFGTNAYVVAMFDEDDNFTSYTEGTHIEIDNMNSIVTVTFTSQAVSTAKYFSINGTTDILNTLMVVKGAQYPAEYVPYGTYKTIDGLYISKSQIIDLDDEANPLKGKIISLNGDSIAAGVGYQGGYGKIIAEDNGMTYENIAVGGGTVAYVSANVHCISRTIANMRSDADYIILDGGGNDADSGVPLGTLSTGYDATLDDTTFAGAFENMLKSAIARFPDKKIGYVFVHKCAYLFSSSVENSYYGIAKAACEKWGIPYCDLNTQAPPLNYINSLKTAYTANGDGYHPNEQGYKLFYVPKITAWMKTI